MSKVTISKIEYEHLKKQATAYRKFAAKFFESMIKDPIEEVVDDFSKTNLYSKEFLKDLESGLRKSSYIKGHGNKTIAKRYRRIS